MAEPRALTPPEVWELLALTEVGKKPNADLIQQLATFDAPNVTLAAFRHPQIRLTLERYAELAEREAKRARMEARGAE